MVMFVKLSLYSFYMCSVFVNIRIRCYSITNIIVQLAQSVNICSFNIIFVLYSFATPPEGRKGHVGLAQLPARRNNNKNYNNNYHYSNSNTSNKANINSINTTVTNSKIVVRIVIRIIITIIIIVIVILVIRLILIVLILL